MKREDLRKVDWKTKKYTYANDNLEEDEQIINSGYFHMWIKDKSVNLDGSEETHVNALIEKENGEMTYVSASDLKFDELI